MVIENLKKYLINENKPEGNSSYGWSAGQQLEALKFYLNKKVVVLAEHKEGGWQGECFSILFVDDKFFLWRDSFGSCSGCDALEGGNGYKYIKDTMTSIKEFISLEELVDYLKSGNRDFLYSKEALNELMKEFSNFINKIGGFNFSNKEIISKIKKLIIVENL